MSTGPQLDLPQATSPEQLETLLNGLLEQENHRLPYLFYVNDRPLGESLGKHLVEHKVRSPSFRLYKDPEETQPRFGTARLRVASTCSICPARSEQLSACIQ